MMKVTIKPMEKRSVVRYLTNGYAEYRIPAILPVEGALLLACDGRSDHGWDFSDVDILVLRMEPDSEPIEVLRIGYGDGERISYDYPIFIPDGKRVHLIYFREWARVFTTTSEDGGRTWSSVREITDTFREFPFEWNCCGGGSGHGICLKSGRLLMPVWIGRRGSDLDEVVNNREKANEKTVYWDREIGGCIYSDDHGQTWKAGGLVGEDFLYDTGEPTVAEMDNGKLLFGFRHGGQDRYGGLKRFLEGEYGEERRRAQCISEDGGDTFGSLWLVDDLRSPACNYALQSIPGGFLFACCDNPDTTDRIHTAVKFSVDGQNWETIWHVDECSGYIDMAVDGDIVYLFYERGKFVPELGHGAIVELALQTGKLIYKE